jgi:hypothetical protein
MCKLYNLLRITMDFGMTGVNPKAYTPTLRFVAKCIVRDGLELNKGLTKKSASSF